MSAGAVIPLVVKMSITEKEKKKFAYLKCFMYVLSRVCSDLSSHLFLKVLSSVSWPKCHLDTKNSWPGRLWTPFSPCCFPDFTIILIFLFFSRSRRTSWVFLCWLWSSWSRRRCCRKSLRLLIKPESDVHCMMSSPVTVTSLLCDDRTGSNSGWHFGVNNVSLPR